MKEFNINQKFEFMEKLVGLIAKRQANSLIITGDAGLGKSHTVLKALAENGIANDSTNDFNEADFRPESFVVVKGTTTAKGMFAELFRNWSSIVVFDDCDDVFKDPTAVNILKGALEQGDNRVISWKANPDRASELPPWFKFEGRVIFISNLPQAKIDQAILTRSLCVDVSMTKEQKIARIKEIALSEGFRPDVSEEVKREALELIEQYQDEIKVLSMRTLNSVIQIRNSGDGWKDLAIYTITN